MTVLIAAALCAALAVWGLWLAFHKVFGVPRNYRPDDYRLPSGAQYQHEKQRMLALIGELSAVPCERVSITSFDGTRLAGRYYHVRDGAPVQIQFHGYHGTAVRDFCGGCKLAREMGCNVLLVDQRAHGESGGRVITFGVRERYDCLAWARYAAERFGPESPLYLAGVSMGAATVLMAAGLPLPENVRGVIADCPYTTAEAIIAKVCRDRHIPPALGVPMLRLGARVFGGFRLEEGDALAAVQRAKVPILFIHGEADRFVPCDMSRALYRACAGPKMLKTVPGAGHGISYIVDSAGYAGAAADFFALCGGAKKDDP